MGLGGRRGHYEWSQGDWGGLVGGPSVVGGFSQAVLGERGGSYGRFQGGRAGLTSGTKGEEGWVYQWS